MKFKELLKILPDEERITINIDNANGYTYYCYFSGIVRTLKESQKELLLDFDVNWIWSQAVRDEERTDYTDNTIVFTTEVKVTLFNKEHKII